jgi:hypothetical protein
MIDGNVVAFDSMVPLSTPFRTTAPPRAALLLFVRRDSRAGKDVMALSLEARRELLKSRVLPKLTDPIRKLPELEASLPDSRSTDSKGWLPNAAIATTSPASVPAHGKRCA